jgi:ABC-type nitrate/sulfonate/bicarbonate transport system substrate-binding protein
MKTLRFVSLVVLLLAAVGGFAQTITIPAAKTVSSIPLLALEGQTIAGLTVATPLFDDHPLALAELIGGKTQVLLTGSTLAVKNSQSGGPLVEIATPVWDVSGLVTLNPDLKALEDFVGKTIVVPLAGGPLDLQLQAILRARGLADKVKIDYAEPAQAVAMLIQKKVDGAALPEPLASRLVVLNKAVELFTFAEAWAPLNNGDGRAPQVSLVARRDWTSAHGDFLRAFLAAYRLSIAAVQADPKAFANKFAPTLGLPAAIVERGLSRTVFALPTPTETAQLFRTYLGLIGETKPVASDFFFQE